ncbi:MAG TPA: HIT domain-containing protein [Candidatus Pacearchaeota archaeon]|nr:HIT domain-containing protein [Candidatus Pacearchaeota archaeon]
MTKETLKKQTKKTEEKIPSELRLDTVSEDWVIVAKTRGKKPDAFKSHSKSAIIAKKDCALCKLEEQLPPLLIFTRNEKIHNPKEIPSDWTTVVIPNKFPALTPVNEIKVETEGGIFEKVTAGGFCELVITSDHDKYIADMELWQVMQVIDAYQQRYLDLMGEKFVKYISIFHNKGSMAGASQPHNHSQIITTPLIDVSLKYSLVNAQKYWDENKKCLYCEMVRVEKKGGKRVFYENDDFIAFCPFASQAAFQIVITPKDHLPYFERITPEQKRNLAYILQISLQAIRKGLNDPDYNFYIKTSPCDNQDYKAYHWHLTIMPKTDRPAGFEIGTEMEICSIEPEKAAEFLRSQL